MTVPAGFQFNQGNLQDYVDCRRRFQLRYLENLAWPAVEAEPALEYERHRRLSARFHHMIYQHLSGVQAADLARSAARDERLNRWWSHFLHFASDPGGLGDPNRLVRYPEVSLSAPLGDQRLVATYDLIVVSPEGQATIYDWKTYRKRPRRRWLARRLQTRTYPYLLVQAGARFNQGQPFLPEKVSMVYWFADYPEEAEHFPYQEGQYREDREYLAGLAREIVNLEADDFIFTDDLDRCQYCVYRSLCDRGVEAGALDALQVEDTDWQGDDFEFDQIAEIEY